MSWSLLIVSGGSAAAGAAMGRVVGRRLRLFMFVGGLEAALLGIALRWLGRRETDPLVDAGSAEVLSLVLFGIAAVTVSFAVGAWLARP